MCQTKQFAKFITELSLDKIPEKVVEKLRVCVLNGYGIGLGSHSTPFFSIAERAVINMDGEFEQGATLLGSGRKSTVAGAALANAALFHGRAQEDTCGVAHFGPILLPLLTSLIECGKGRVEDLLISLLAGYEIGGALETAYSSMTTSSGLRASPLYGTIAAAAATAKLWGLSVEQTAAALANAAAFTGGTLQSFGEGTDEWRYQIGVAARIGLTAAALAAEDSKAATYAFEGESGFVRAFVGEGKNLEGIASQLGSDWSVLKVTFKPYPVCALNQTPVQASLQLREMLGERVKNIQSLEVYLNPIAVGYAGMDSHGPFTSISATLMSVQFCIATTLLYGVPTVSRMTDFDDLNVNKLVTSIQLNSDENLGLLACRVEARLQDSIDLVIHQLDLDHMDYNYDRSEVSKLIRRIGEETGVDSEAYGYLEKFTEALPDADMNDVLIAFQKIQ